MSAKENPRARREAGCSRRIPGNLFMHTETASTVPAGEQGKTQPSESNGSAALAGIKPFATTKPSVKSSILRIANSLRWSGFYKRAIPILCYHSIPDRSSFQSQMTYLRETGCSVIALEDLCAWMRHPVSLSRPAVVLTFDDCYFDQFANAVPVLRAFGYPATFFAVTQWIGKGGRQEGRPAKLPLMGEGELRELRQLGFGIGCHSRTHRPLSEGLPEFQKAEIRTAKQELEDVLREEVHFFCFPHGHYTAHSVEAVKLCGFKAAASVRVGAVRATDDLFTLKRLCIPSRPTEEELKAQLTWIPPMAEIVHKVAPLTKLARVIWKPR
jgi:peptidoglycan/xylan/chitin deacetylase (PgdA/CDA1 family)